MSNSAAAHKQEVRRRQGIYLLPVGLALLLAGDDARQPLDRAGTSDPGDYHPQGEPMVC